MLRSSLCVRLRVVRMAASDSARLNLGEPSYKYSNRYLEQEVFRPAMALALLYCTVLSFGMVMTACVQPKGAQ
jgi:Trk-type K+ transport system membrane component